MNLTNICDVLQEIGLLLLSITAMSQSRRINELEENALEMTKAIIKTRMELELPAFPPEPEEDEK